MSAFVALVLFRPHGQYGSSIIAGFESATAVLSCLVLGRNYRRVSTPDSRRRIRWAVLAVASSVTTFFLFASLRLVCRLTGSAVARHWSLFVDDAAPFVVLYPTGLCCGEIPGFRNSSRSPARLAVPSCEKRVTIDIFLPFLIFVAKLSAVRAAGERCFAAKFLAFYMALGTAAAVGLRYRVQIRPWLDRRFFRLALGPEQMLLTLWIG